MLTSQPASLSNAVWALERGHRGTGLGQRRMPCTRHEKFIRAEVTDEQVKKGFE